MPLTTTRQRVARSAQIGAIVIAAYCFFRYGAPFIADTGRWFMRLITPDYGISCGITGSYAMMGGTYDCIDLSDEGFNRPLQFAAGCIVIAILIATASWLHWLPTGQWYPKSPAPATKEPSPFPRGVGRP